MLPTSKYPMWHNVIPPLVPLNSSLYLAYPTRTKGFDSSIFKNYTCYVPGNVYPAFEQLVVPPTYIPYSVGNQFSIVVQLVTNKEKCIYWLDCLDANSLDEFVTNKIL
jgi:hypothetical protein